MSIEAQKRIRLSALLPNFEGCSIGTIGIEELRKSTILQQLIGKKEED